jgi:hypothetical protein
VVGTIKVVAILETQYLRQKVHKFGAQVWEVEVGSDSATHLLRKPSELTLGLEQGDRLSPLKFGLE